MTAQREKFSSRAPSDVLVEMRAIARQEGRQFHVVLEDAMREYIKKRIPEGVRPEAWARYRESVERHRVLYELLAQS